MPPTQAWQCSLPRRRCTSCFAVTSLVGGGSKRPHETRSSLFMPLSLSSWPISMATARAEIERMNHFQCLSQRSTCFASYLRHCCYSVPCDTKCNIEQCGPTTSVPTFIARPPRIRAKSSNLATRGIHRVVNVYGAILLLESSTEILRACDSRNERQIDQNTGLH